MESNTIPSDESECDSVTYERQVISYLSSLPNSKNASIPSFTSSKVPESSDLSFSPSGKKLTSDISQVTFNNSHSSGKSIMSGKCSDLDDDNFSTTAGTSPTAECSDASSENQHYLKTAVMEVCDVRIGSDNERPASRDAAQMCTSTPNAKCSISNFDNSSDESLCEIVQPPSLLSVKDDYKRNTNDNSIEVLTKCTDSLLNLSSTTSDCEPCTSKTSIPECHSSRDKKETPFLVSDIEDSEEYEEAVTSYLDSVYGFRNQCLSPNVEDKPQSDFSTSNDSDASSLSQTSSGSDTDFLPARQNRKKTLNKKKIWKILESEMLKDQREENATRRKLLKENKRKTAGDKKCSDFPTDKRKASTNKSIDRTLLDGIIKIMNAGLLLDEDLINTNVGDNKNKDALNELNQSFVDHRKTILRNDFLKRIHVSYLKSKQETAGENKCNTETSNVANDRNGYSLGNISCDICDINFVRLSGLHNHMARYHEGDNLKICEKCGRSFSLDEDYSKHVDINHSESVQDDVKCYLCGKEFIPDFTGHYEQCHSIWDFYVHKCVNCNLRFVNEYVLSRHMTFGCYICYICNKKVPAKSLIVFKKHLLSHYKLPTHICRYCNKSFMNRRGCKTHIIVQHCSDKASLPFPCDKCDSKFLYKTKLNEHISRCHSDNLYKCEDCNKFYRSLYSLSVHKKIHHSGISDKFICNFCNLEFKHKYLIINHLDYDACKCPWCGANTGCVNKLADHINVHRLPGSNKLQCTHCTHSLLPNVQQYRRHLFVSHPSVYVTVNKNVVSCDRCGHLCSSKHHLKKHLRLSCRKSKTTSKISVVSDRGNKNVKMCGLCNKKFKTRMLLKNHFLHANTFCTICNENFNCNTRLNDHLKSSHNGSSDKEQSGDDKDDDDDDEDNHKNDKYVFRDDTKESNDFLTNASYKDNKENCEPLKNPNNGDTCNYKASFNEVPSYNTYCSNNYSCLSDGYVGQEYLRAKRSYHSDTSVNEIVGCKNQRSIAKSKILYKHFNLQDYKKSIQLNSSEKFRFKSNKAFLPRDSLFSHINLFQNIDKPIQQFRCVICEVLFKSETEFKMHYGVIKNCMFCGELFSCCYSFEKHVINNCTRNSSDFCKYLLKYKCCVCKNRTGKIFLSIRNLVKHFVNFHYKCHETIGRDRFIVLFTRKQSNVNGTILQDKRNILNEISISDINILPQNKTTGFDDSVNSVLNNTSSKLNLSLECNLDADSLAMNIKKFELDYGINFGDFSKFNNRLTLN